MPRTTVSVRRMMNTLSMMASTSTPATLSSLACKGTGLMEDMVLLQEQKQNKQDGSENVGIALDAAHQYLLHLVRHPKHILSKPLVQEVRCQCDGVTSAHSAAHFCKQGFAEATFLLFVKGNKEGSVIGRHSLLLNFYVGRNRNSSLFLNQVLLKYIKTKLYQAGKITASESHCILTQ